MNASRISLRRFDLSDMDDFLKWASDDRVTCNLRWDSITSRDEALKYLEKEIISHPWYHAICLDDRAIGYVAVWQGSGDQKCRANMGYAIAFEYWGQGITTIAVRMAVPKVFEEMPDLVRLEAYVLFSENKGSERVLEKVGFLKEGLLRKLIMHKGEARDSVIYSFLSTDKLS